MSFEAFVSSIVSKDLRNIALHWNDARGDRLMPGWGNIRPSKIAAQLPLLWTYRYDPVTDSFTGRLAGDQIEQVFGKSFRGTPMAEIYSSSDYPRLFQRTKRVTIEPAFFLGKGTVFRHVDRYGEGERIILPLAEDGIHGDGVIGGTVYDSHRGSPENDSGEAENWFSLTD